MSARKQYHLPDCRITARRRMDVMDVKGYLVPAAYDGCLPGIEFSRDWVGWARLRAGRGSWVALVEDDSEEACLRLLFEALAKSGRKHTDVMVWRRGTDPNED